MLKPLSRRAITCLIAVGVLMATSAVVALTNAGAVPRAAFTTVNTHFDGSGHCQNGNPQVNCNIYDAAQYVWLNGGPAIAELGDGTFVFAVVQPGGQQNPNDGSPGLLSTDKYTNRTFSVSGGKLSYNGTHAFDNNKIRLIPFAATPNPGGENILAICRIGDGVPVSPRDCKYDAFKVKGNGSTDTTTPQGSTTTTTSNPNESTTTTIVGETTTTTTEQTTTSTTVEAPTTTTTTPEDTTSTTESTTTTTIEF
ncbi:MAG TPA: hypothetical protein VL856_01700 [Acidimicrobiia bacterium]|jgi:hypothetical protein|nr:hypothetical protein [Acidimicrobiia bacterium]